MECIYFLCMLIWSLWYTHFIREIKLASIIWNYLAIRVPGYLSNTFLWILSTLIIDVILDKGVLLISFSAKKKKKKKKDKQSLLHFGPHFFKRWNFFLSELLLVIVGVGVWSKLCDDKAQVEELKMHCMGLLMLLYAFFCMFFYNFLG